MVPSRNQPASVIYLSDARRPAEEAHAAAAAQGVGDPMWLSQRHSRLGWIGAGPRPRLPTAAAARAAWQRSQPVLLPQMAASPLPAHQADIAAAQALMTAVLEGEDIEQRLRQADYAARLAPQFDLLGASFDEGDPQEIVKLEFDALDDGTLVAENLWVKLSWLSFEEDDASLRFRFSFGLENFEDVAADPLRQHYAAALTDALFPESAVISANTRLHAFLREMLGGRDFSYVERIVYFNAPEGGAQFHNDVERGHLGVVFAQLSGRTAWLALSTEQLLDAIRGFLAAPEADGLLRATIRHAKTRAALIAIAQDRDALAEALNRHDNDPVERLLNRTPAFTRRLIDAGHAFILHPGDVILLPQEDAGRCAWHAVYCLDDEPGEALSFAIRYA